MHDPIKHWEIQASTGKHFDVLDGMRGVAIIMVVAFHVFYTNPESGKLIHALGDIVGMGWLGVPIFFALSGFLISYPFFRKRAADSRFWYLKGYTLRRIGKIIPPFYLSILVFAVYYLLRFSDLAYLRTALQWLVGLPSFFPNKLLFNISYWSLVVEAHFYILLPLLFFLVRGLNLRYTVLFLFFVLFAVPLVVRQLTWPDQPFTKDSVVFLMQRFPCELDFFAWGILFSGIFVSVSGTFENLRALSLLGYVGLLLLLVSIGLGGLWIGLFDFLAYPTRWGTEVFHLLPGVSVFLMLFFVFDPRCLGTRLLANSVLRFVGIVSYEWFLLHGPIIYLFKDIFGPTHGSLIMFALKIILPIVLSFGLSVLMYRYFSLPLMNRIRGIPKTKH
jgi:peptidoglycan/LPS O-acetylase OafA/YrhL